MLAICISCGNQKKSAFAVCRECQFDPAQNEDSLLKSVYLSEGRFEDELKRENYRDELNLIARAIREGGEDVDFDKNELERLRVQKESVGSVTNQMLAGALFRFLGPGLLFIGILFGLLFLLKRLNR